ncbi:MAG: hypothetical protein K1X78_25640 [Verrucomicrobiaceae bacterium]|nr:hypothetical protein [Verrucomicrobiaceae bacterium]
MNAPQLKSARDRAPHCGTPLLPGVIACIVLCCVFASAAHAQFASNIALTKTNFLALEPLVATVTITNRSGADVVMSGANESNWLTFDISDANGRSLAPIGLQKAKPFIFKAGTTIAEKVVISDNYGIDQLGAYGISATVYHPPTKQHYASNRVRFNILDSKPIWEAPFGVPAGRPDAGRVRRYALIIFRDVDKANLYFRLIDDRLNQKLATYELGPVTNAVDPEPAVDRDNTLHVFFLAMPKIYCYAIIGPDGKLKKREYYKEVDTNRPAMIAAGDGTVAVRGGEFFDPAAPPPQKAKGRSVSERPPGL